MSFYKVTYHEQHRFATLHNHACTFRCRVCSYKLASGADGRPGRRHPPPERFLTPEEMKRALRGVPVEKVFFMGGEPTVAADLPEMLDFAKNTLGTTTSLGHTNGGRLPLPDLDGANVGLKAWDEKVHLEYTGRRKGPIFDNVAAPSRPGSTSRPTSSSSRDTWTWTRSRRSRPGWRSSTPGFPSTSPGTSPSPGSRSRGPRRSTWPGPSRRPASTWRT